MKRDQQKLPKLAYQQDKLGFGMHYLSDQSLQLLKKLIERYEYYDGIHRKSPITGEPLTADDLQAMQDLAYKPTLMTINLVAWFVEQLASFMFEQPPSIQCEAEQIDDSVDMGEGVEPSPEQQRANEIAASREWLLKKIARQNLLDEKLLQAALDYLIGGSVVATLHCVDNGGLRIIWRPRMECWPVYSYDDVEALEKLHLVAYVDDQTLWKRSYWMKSGSCWVNEALYNPDLTVKESVVSDTDLRLPFIPAEIIDRGKLTNEIEGRSVIDRLKALNDEIDAKVGDNADSLRFGMFAIRLILNADLNMVVTATNQPAKDKLPKISPNALWMLDGTVGVPADAKVLEQKFEYTEALAQHLATLKGLMHQLSNVPDIDLTKVGGLGSMSGFALKLLYGPIISETTRAMTTWVPRLERLLGKALYMLGRDSRAASYYDSEWVKDADLAIIKSSELDELAKVVPRLPLPEDENEIIDREMKKASMLLTTLKDAMSRLGVSNPEQKLAEILAEKKTLQEVLGGIPDDPELPSAETKAPEQGEAQ